MVGVAVGGHYGFRPRSLPEPLLHLGTYLFGVPRRPGVDQYPRTSRLPDEVGVHNAQGQARHALFHVDACFGLAERRIVRRSFESHADDVSLDTDPRHVLWAERPIGYAVRRCSASAGRIRLVPLQVLIDHRRVRLWVGLDSLRRGWSLHLARALLYLPADGLQRR